MFVIICLFATSSGELKIFIICYLPSRTLNGGVLCLLSHSYTVGSAAVCTVGCDGTSSDHITVVVRLYQSKPVNKTDHGVF